MNRIIMPILLLVLLVPVSGCAYVVTEGRDFNSSLRTELTINKTSKDDVVKLLDKPAKIKNPTINGQTYEIYYYDFIRGEYPKQPYLKTLEVKFKEGQVQGYELFSTFPDDFMTFDQKKMDQVIINKTSSADVLKLFGPPHGRSLKSATILSKKAKDVPNAVEVWSYRGGILNDSKADFKSFTLYFDNQGIVIETTFE